MAIQEGLWDCQTCGTKRILGRHKACIHCGQSRPEKTRFYLAEDAPDVADPEGLRMALAGADWLCGYCGASNMATMTDCKQCGAKAGTSPKQTVKEYGLDEVPRSGDPGPKQPQAAPRQVISSSRRSNKKFIWLAAIIGIVALFFFLFRFRDVTLTAQGFSWERTLDIEDFRTMVESDWSVPNGGRIKSQNKEVHHYNEVIDHYETRKREVSERVQVGTETYVCGKRDLGNGYFEDKTCTRPTYETRHKTETYQEPIYRKEPVYQTKYTYEIDRWVLNRTEKSSGKDREAFWPNVSLTQKEREGKRSETYTVHFVDPKKKSYLYTTTETEWLSFEEGKSYLAKVGLSGRVFSVEKASK